jgi:hypothetical protein
VVLEFPALHVYAADAAAALARAPRPDAVPGTEPGGLERAAGADARSQPRGAWGAGRGVPGP